MEITNIHARARFEAAREQGLAEGLAEGEARGLAEGVAQGKRDSLDRVLKSNFPEAAEAARARYADATIEELDRYFDRALKAETLDEVFED